MPAMTSRTKVCAPKPIATPTTLVPAISGPISTPSSASAIITATAITSTNRMLRKISSKVCKRARRRLLAVRLAELGCCGELAVDRSLRSVPEDVGDQQNHDCGQYAVDDAGKNRIPAGEVHEVDLPTPSQHRHCANDQQSSDPVFECCFDDAGWTAGLRRPGGTEQMLDRAPAHGDGGRQKDQDKDEPEARIDARHARCDDPEYPQ